MGARESLLRVGAKNFSLTFEGGHVDPYHIKEKRGRFIGSLWLGKDGLEWVIKTWGLLSQSTDLKGFFRFFRTK